ncbi:hypothetical protein FOA52_003466 [Chlamydomonas sp. UWO 241]|nr:hypothetical protein FOA52_003466 [Chlamydomonas sp. UWO 241]
MMARVCHRFTSRFSARQPLSVHLTQRGVTAAAAAAARKTPTTSSTSNDSAEYTGETRNLTIAVEGCAHGELDAIYAALAKEERATGRRADLLICCGDFQAVRNADDLETMAVPPKYRQMNSFWRYYAGLATAPVPTLFIGGNHEAAAHNYELYYGGWAAPNIFFLGFSGVVRFGGLRIGGLSGVYKDAVYSRPRTERLPYTSQDMRSTYAVRDFEVDRLLQLSQPLDIFVSHDWPRNVVHHGDLERLLHYKPFLRNEIESGTFGSPASERLMDALRPERWFAAHMHTRFEATVHHNVAAIGNVGAAAASNSGRGRGGGGGGGGSTTRFLALNKCLPRREFLELVDIHVPCPAGGTGAASTPVLEYDEEWLAIIRGTHHWTTGGRGAPTTGGGGERGATERAEDDPALGGGGATERASGAAAAAATLPPSTTTGGGPGPAQPQPRGPGAGPDPADLAFVRGALAARGGAQVPRNWASTVGAHCDGARARGRMPAAHLANPQTAQLLEMLQLPDTLRGAAVRVHGGEGSMAVDGAAAHPGASEAPAQQQAQQQQARRLLGGSAPQRARQQRSPRAPPPLRGGGSN